MLTKEGHTGDLSTAGWRKSSKSGPYSDNCVLVAPLVGGLVALRDSKDPDGEPQVYTPGEWRAFIDGAKDGEFDFA